MRHVYENPREAAAKGAAARKLMLSQYSPDVVGHLVAKEVLRIKDSIRCGLVPEGRCYISTCVVRYRYDTHIIMLAKVLLVFNAREPDYFGPSITQIGCLFTHLCVLLWTFACIYLTSLKCVPSQRWYMHQMLQS